MDPLKVAPNMDPSGKGLWTPVNSNYDYFRRSQGEQLQEWLKDKRMKIAEIRRIRTLLTGVEYTPNGQRYKGSYVHIPDPETKDVDEAYNLWKNAEMNHVLEKIRVTPVYGRDKTPKSVAYKQKKEEFLKKREDEFLENTKKTAILGGTSKQNIKITATEKKLKKRCLRFRKGKCVSRYTKKQINLLMKLRKTYKRKTNKRKTK